LRLLNWAWKICGRSINNGTSVDVDADRQLTSQKRRREATRLDSFIENDMTDSDSDDEASQDEFSKWLSLSRERRCEDPLE
jgi:hypothetical protein